MCCWDVQEVCCVGLCQCFVGFGMNYVGFVEQCIGIVYVFYVLVGGVVIGMVYEIEIYVFDILCYCRCIDEL